MQRIFKYELNPISASAEMPEKAEVISAAFQGDALCVWAVVDEAAPLETVKFAVVPTGHAIIDNSIKFINTVFLDTYVFHVFKI